MENGKVIEEILKETLEACPFCGGEATARKLSAESVRVEHITFHVGCRNRGCWILPSAVSLNCDEAVEDWNTRNAPRRSL